MKHPPGRVVYQNGAYHIYEVDGAEQKVFYSILRLCSCRYHLLQLYCQNLSLFGKLFIDIKTLFFDCENCKYSDESRKYYSHRRDSPLLYSDRR